MKDVKVVCFDIDGTLYPKWVTNLLLLASLFPSPLLALRYNLYRRSVRKEQSETEPRNYRKRQAATIAKSEESKKVDRLYDAIEHQFYQKWKKSFAKIKPYPHLRSAMEWLLQKGFRIAALSDFPIENKLNALNVADLIEFSLCTEESGYLKPHPEPFLLLCDHLHVEPKEVLYVGDSCYKDIEGASSVGMKSCLFNPRAKGFREKKILRKCSLADIICSDYLEFVTKLERLIG